MPGKDESQTDTDLTNAEFIPSFYSINVGIYRFRVVIGTLLVACFIIVVMALVFGGTGLKVDSFKAAGVNEDQQKNMLDKYNTISGALAAFVMKPLNMFLEMVIAVAFICVATGYSVHQERRRRCIVLVVIGVVGYMMNIGFSALNMQVIPGEVHSKINSADLYFQNDYKDGQPLDGNKFVTTTWDPSFREDASENSVQNTILRNLFFPIEEVPTWCKRKALDLGLKPYGPSLGSAFTRYGFPTRSWQGKALQQAVEPNTLTVKMSSDEASLGSDDSLPMNKSIATNLVVYAMLVSNNMLGWWKPEDDVWGRQSDNVYNLNFTGRHGMAEYLNLTTSTSPNDTFIRTAHNVIVDYYNKTSAANTTDELSKIEFSHVALSDTIAFDALTIEIPTQHFRRRNNANLTISPLDFPLFRLFCNTESCVIPPEMLRSITGVKPMPTIHPRVQALAICVNANSEEDVIVDFNYGNASEYLQSCDQKSNSSMIVVSVGKRIEGDWFGGVTQEVREQIVDDARTKYGSNCSDIVNKFLSGRITVVEATDELVEVLPTEILLSEDGAFELFSMLRGGQITNARVVYSLTVGRLSWRAENLSTTYKADCAVGDCSSLRFPLESTNSSSPDEILLVSAENIPTEQLSPINLNAFYYNVSASDWKILVSAFEEAREPTIINKTPLVVIPRNFQRQDPSFKSHMITQGGSACGAFVDRYLNHIEKNHLYMERTLQPAYTAGLYFLLQNGVVHDVVHQEGNSNKTLKFDGDTHEMDVRASIPTISLIIAIIGCVLMVVGGVIVTVLGRQTELALLDHVSPHTVAEAIINEEKFPHRMLRLQLRDTSTGELQDVLMNQLRIQSMVLMNVDDKSQQFVVGGDEFLIMETPKTPKDSQLDMEDDNACIEIPASL